MKAILNLKEYVTKLINTFPFLLLVGSYIFTANFYYIIIVFPILIFLLFNNKNIYVDNNFNLLTSLLIISVFSLIIFNETYYHILSTAKKMATYLCICLIVSITSIKYDDVINTIIKFTIFNNIIILIQIIMDLFSISLIVNGGFHGIGNENNELFRKYGLLSSLQIVGFLNIILLFYSKYSFIKGSAGLIFLFISSRSFFILGIIFKIVQNTRIVFYVILLSAVFDFITGNNLYSYLNTRYSNIVGLSLFEDASIAENVSWYINLIDIPFVTYIIGNGAPRHSINGGHDIIIDYFILAYGIFGLFLALFFIYNILSRIYKIDMHMRFIIIILILHEFKSSLVLSQGVLDTLLFLYFTSYKLNLNDKVQTKITQLQ